jgi:uncharacterized protein (DUF1778 family)
MKLNVRHKTTKERISLRLEQETVRMIKSLAKENNSSESTIVDALIQKGSRDDK